MSTKESKPASHLPTSATDRTGVKLAPRPGPRAQAGGAGGASLEADLGGEAPNGIFEVKVNGVMEIFAL